MVQVERLNEETAACSCCGAALDNDGQCEGCLEHECSCRFEFMNEDDPREDR